MSQSSVIAGSLIVAFIVFITLRGELPCYLKVLGISTGAQCNPGNTALGSIIAGIMTGTTPPTGTPAPSPSAGTSNQSPVGIPGTLVPCPNGGYTLTGIC